MIQKALWQQEQHVKPAVAEREWQRYRGWSLKILEVLEHSGGETTASISDAIKQNRMRTRIACYQMRAHGLIERVERWGWRITSEGIFLLYVQHNTKTVQQQYNNSTTTVQLTLSETAPSCYSASTCHIKRICAEKSYSPKNAMLCEACVWLAPAPKLPSAVPAEAKDGG
jgi:hypothetical protein